MRSYSSLFLYCFSILFASLIMLVVIEILTPVAHAFNMVNNAYTIDTSSSDANINIHNIPLKKENANNYIPSYSLREGFNHTQEHSLFQETIWPNTINFGPLNSGSPIYRTSQITISNVSSYGYTITAQEDHPLLNSSTTSFIPDTTCDNGVCNQSSSDQWSNVLTYGFGYRCDDLIATNCAIGFSNTNYFKAFASSPSSSIIMASSGQENSSSVQITYKVNISPTQQTGLYRNGIIYIAIPQF